MFCWTTVLPVALLLSVAVGQSGEKTVTVKAGDDVTLDIRVGERLRGDYGVVWTYGPNNAVLIYLDNGTLLVEPPERFELNETTGSLTIRSATSGDAGRYEGQIINGNGASQMFLLSVEPVTTPPPPPPSPSPSSPSSPPAPHNRTHWIAVGLVSGFILLVLILLYVKKKKIAEIGCGDKGDNMV